MARVSLMRNLVSSLFTVLSFVPVAHSGLDAGIVVPKVQKKYASAVCPNFLVDWVSADYQDVTSFQKSYKSEASICNSIILGHREWIRLKSERNSTLNTDDLSHLLGEKFSEHIDTKFRPKLGSCPNLPGDQAKTALARFYRVGNKLANFNSSIIDDIAFLDSILPNTYMLVGLDCPRFWPSVLKKCSNYRKHGLSCGGNKEEKLKALVQKTKDTIPIIETKKKAYQDCTSRVMNEPGARIGRDYTPETQKKLKQFCESIWTQVKILQAEVPWIQGKQFEELTVKKKPQPRSYDFYTEYDLSDQTLEKAIQSQFQSDRSALVNEYQKNLSDFRCLEKGSDLEACNFKELSKRQSSFPELRNDLFDLNKEFEHEASAVVGAEKCLMDRSQDREETKEFVDDKIKKIVGLASGVGLARILGMLNMDRYTRAALGLMVGHVYSVGVYINYYKCANHFSGPKISIENKDSPKEEVCRYLERPLAQISKDKSSCLEESLIKHNDLEVLIPFSFPAVKGIAGVTEIARSSSASTLATVATLEKTPEINQALEIFWGNHKYKWIPSPKAPSETKREFDAVFIPTRGRPEMVERILQEKGLEKENVWLLPTDPSDVGKLNLEENRTVTVFINSSSEDPFVQLPTLKLFPEISQKGTLDLIGKKNAALKLAREKGWKRIAFFDDDIMDIHPGIISGMKTGLDQSPVVGSFFSGVTDHSAVGHLLSRVTKSERNFMGGGAFAVDVEKIEGNFLPMYNEDWFFNFGQTGLPTIVGSVTHAPPTSTITVERIMAQEVGDILAEGMRFRNSKGLSLAGDEQFWKQTLESRKKLLEWLIANGDKKAPVDDWNTVKPKLNELIEAQKQISPGSLNKMANEIVRGYPRK